MATTQLHPGGLVGQPFGDFSGREPFVPFVIKTQLHAGAITGRRYGSFAGRVPVVPVPVPVPGGGALLMLPPHRPRVVVARGGVTFGPPRVGGRAVVVPRAPAPVPKRPRRRPVPAEVAGADFAADDELAILAAGAALMFGDV